MNNSGEVIKDEDLNLIFEKISSDKTLKEIQLNHVCDCRCSCFKEIGLDVESFGKAIEKLLSDSTLLKSIRLLQFTTDLDDYIIRGLVKCKSLKTLYINGYDYDSFSFPSIINNILYSNSSIKHIILDSYSNDELETNTTNIINGLDQLIVKSELDITTNINNNISNLLGYSESFNNNFEFYSITITLNFNFYNSILNYLKNYSFRVNEFFLIFSNPEKYPKHHKFTQFKLNNSR
ncbi:hypothetical protein ACTFIT_001542 [Dictyostelium discoideum]